MRFERVVLENFKCYADADLSLDDGVTVVHGVNGSGKSSLLEACFFALYGSAAVEGTRESVIRTGEESCSVELWFRHAGADYHLERTLKDYGDRVSHDSLLEGPNDEQWEGATAVDGAITDLLRMDAESFVNCAYVQQGEVNKLIHASPSQRQDVLDDLLQLGKLEEYRERASDARLGVKDVLDNATGRLEELDSQVEAKEEKDLHEQLNALESELAETVEEIDHLESQVETAEETLADAEAILEEHAEKREELSALEDDVEELTAKIAATERERDDLQDEIATRREELEDAESERDDRLDAIEFGEPVLEESGTDGDPLERAEVVAEAGTGGDADGKQGGVNVAAVESRKVDLDERVEEIQERINELSVEIGSKSDKADRLAERADELAAEAASKREQASDLASEIEAAESDLEDGESTLEAIDEEIAEHEAAFDDAPIAFGEAERHLESLRKRREERRGAANDLRAEVESLRDRIEEGEELLAAGKCPECGQPVADSPHVDSLEDDREELSAKEAELESLEEALEALGDEIDEAEGLREAEREVENCRERREDREQLLAEKRSSIADRRERRDELLETADELETEAAEKREAAEAASAAADDRRSDLGDANREKATVAERVDALDALVDAAESVAALSEEVERLREERASKAELNDERRERLAEKRERKTELEEVVQERNVEKARDEKARAESYLEQAEEKLETLRAERDDVQSRVGAVENELEELESLREQREAAGERVEALESLYEEAQDLQDMYAGLRSELRRQNVETLERMLNETFDLVYQNDSYSHIELSGDYELTVYQKDGETLDPEQLSGGERALFNLSLRCAIYRLLAEGVEGTAPMPPLILDEPTVFLDSGHVTQLLTLVETMRVEYGVEQILVVSHDEELVGAADALVHVTKDSTTNRSTVERGETPTAELLADD